MALGITFSETMAGPFALGVDGPEAGRDKGKRDGTTLTMNARVAIDDLDAFIADPKHLGGLSGTIDFAPLGHGLVAPQGVFNLFSPTDDPGMKHMVYELGFATGDSAYYVAGHKKVKDERGFDLWTDTTTLYTSLHEGDGKDGPVSGAGVLSLGARDLMDLMSTVRVTGSDQPIEVATTLAKFGGFFMGELWDSYGPEVLKAAAGGRLG